MRILIIDTFYGPYLKRLYERNELAQKPWELQHRAHFAGGFGTGDAYSNGLKSLGVEAIEIVANSYELQQAWAQEYNPALLQLGAGPQMLLAILEAQIRWWKPTVLYVQDINWLPAAFLNHVKPQWKWLWVKMPACKRTRSKPLQPNTYFATALRRTFPQTRNTLGVLSNRLR